MMAFPDYPFPEDSESFVHHTVVLKYLENYAEHYQLVPHIKVRIILHVGTLYSIPTYNASACCTYDKDVA